ncbi:MAG: hypothetical protein ACM3JB_19480 [Acidobacteriaceae bacterium]
MKLIKQKRVSIQIRNEVERNPVPIVADGAMSTIGVHGGRLIPLVLLNTSDRPDVARLIQVHESFAPGDVNFQWGQIDGHDGTVALFLNFIRPVELFMMLAFNVVAQGILVEQALTGEGLYIARAESLDDRFKKNINRPKVLVELGGTGFEKQWQKLFHKAVVQHFRENGLSRSESRRAATSAITELRKLGALRMRDILPEHNQGG